MSLFDRLLARFRKPEPVPTPQEKVDAALADNRCPDCGERTLFSGPRGGAAVNMACGTCLSEFNILIFAGPPRLLHRMGKLSPERARTVYGFTIISTVNAPWPNEDPRYPPSHPLSRESNAAARASGMQLPKR
jgi:hypothetical protein